MTHSIRKMAETLTPVQLSPLVQIKNPDLVGSIPESFEDQYKSPKFDMKRRLDNWVAARGADKDSHKERKDIAKAIESDLKRIEKSKHLRNTDVLKRTQVIRNEANRLADSGQHTGLEPGVNVQQAGLVIKSVDVKDAIEKSSVPGKWGESNKKYRLELIRGTNGEMIARKRSVNADNTSGALVEEAVIGADGSTRLTILPTGSSFQYDTDKRRPDMIARDVVAKDEDGKEKWEKAWEAKDDEGNPIEVKKPIFTTETQKLEGGIGTMVNFASPDIQGATDLQEGAITLFNQLATKVIVESQKIPAESGASIDLVRSAHVVAKKIDNLDLNLRNSGNKMESSMDLWARETLDPPYNNYSPEYLKMIQDESKLKDLLAGSRSEAQTFKEWFDEMGFIARAMKKKGRILDIKGGNGFLLRSLQEWTGWSMELAPYIEDPNEELILEAQKLFPKNDRANFTNSFLPDLLADPIAHNFPTEFDNVLWTVDSFVDFDNSQDLSILERLFKRVDGGGRLVVPFPDYDRSFNRDNLTQDEIVQKEREIQRVNRLLDYLETDRAKDLGIRLGGMIRNDRSHKGLVIWIDNPTKKSYSETIDEPNPETPIEPSL